MVTTNSFFRIKGDSAELVEERVIHQGATRNLIPLLASPIDSNILNLPNGVRHVFTAGSSNQMHIVVEQPPAVRTIHFAREGEAGYTLGFPWTYFVFIAERPEGSQAAIGLSEYLVFASPTRVTRLDQPLYAMPTNNVYRDGRICFGSAGVDPGANLGEHLDNLVTSFWYSNFNQDVRPTFPFGSYAQWDIETEGDPNCWQRWDWPELAEPQTLQEIANISADRTVRIEFGDVIPALPREATWGRVEEWIDSLSADQRARLEGAFTRLNQ